MSKLSAPSDAPSAPPEPPVLTEDIAPQSTPPPTPPSLPEAPADPNKLAVPADAEAPRPPRRRVARRRPAGPSRNRIAANDDGPSIGGLIYALQQKPSNTPFKFAATVSIIWAAISIAFGIVALRSDAPVLGLIDLVSRPTTFFTIAAIVLPISVLWLLALLAWRTEELRLRSSTMTEVAIRLAEPDRLAEQSAASLGQAVRRQVSFMNDAISRALGRAGELEAMVHNEVTLLERSYEENERKIRGLIQELSGERHALVNTSDTITEIPSAAGRRDPGADGQALRSAGEACTDHLRRKREPHLARGLAGDERRQPGVGRRRAHRTAPGHARDLHVRARGRARQPRRAVAGQPRRPAPAARYLARQPHREPADRVRGVRDRAR